MDFLNLRQFPGCVNTRSWSRLTLVMGSLILLSMGGRYGKYGEIKRLARLRQHNMSLPFRVRGGKAALERQPHGKKDIHAGKARKKR